MKRKLLLTGAIVAALGMLGGGLGVAGGGGSTGKVKTDQPGKKLQLAQFEIQGQIVTRQGNKQGRKKCLNNRKMVVKGPPKRAAERASTSAAHLTKLGTTRTNKKGKWGITAGGALEFSRGTYQVTVKSKTVTSKSSGQTFKCKSMKKFAD